MRFLTVWIFACLLLGTPFLGSNVAELTPAELLYLQQTEHGVLAVCDGGFAARGETVESAVEALHDAAPGRLFLGTVDHLVVAGMSVDAAMLMELGLRPAVGVCQAENVEDPDALAKYLRVHGSDVTLGMLEEDPKLSVPRLVQGETGLVLPGYYYNKEETG